MIHKNLRQAARGRHCTFRLPGCLNDDTVVLCHAPSVESGMGLKSPCWWGAWGCASCHDVMDRRKKSLAPMMPKERPQIWLDAIFETQMELHKDQLLMVRSQA